MKCDRVMRTHTHRSRRPWSTVEHCPCPNTHTQTHTHRAKRMKIIKYNEIKRGCPKFIDRIDSYNIQHNGLGFGGRRCWLCPPDAENAPLLRRIHDGAPFTLSSLPVQFAVERNPTSSLSHVHTYTLHSSAAQTLTHKQTIQNATR